MIVKILCLIVFCISILVDVIYLFSPRFGKESKYDLPSFIISIIIGILCAYVLIN